MTYDLQLMTTPLVISRKILETPEAVSLVFSIPKDLESKFKFSAGQFLTLFLPVEEGFLPRSYSISSSPLVDSELKVTIKRVPGGRGSNYICDHLKEGDTVRVSPPAGHFFKPPADSTPRHFMLFAAGSGITPIFSIMKTVLTINSKHTVTMVYANRHPDQIIYRDELDSWTKKYADRLKVVHIFSQPKGPCFGLEGRCEGDLLKGLISDHFTKTDIKNTEVYMCGPTSFMNNIREEFLSAGLRTEQVHEEAFTSSPNAIPADQNPKNEYTLEDGPETRIFIGDDVHLSTPEEVIAVIGRKEFRAPIKPGQTIIEALIAADANPPYSCLEGACMACMAKVCEGRVYQDDPGILSEENIEVRETLTCQARPVTRIVRVDYDSF